MPGSSKHPLRRRFVVYALEVYGIPFYLGVGESEKNRLWSERAEDRVRFVEYLRRREASGKPVKWCMSTRAIAEFLKLGHRPNVRYLDKGMTRKEALSIERDEIARRVASGAILANHHYNSNFPPSPEAVVQAVLKKKKQTV